MLLNSNANRQGEALISVLYVFLEIGNGGMNDDEYVAHFSLWAAIKSPLIMGNDLRKITPSALSILSNPAVLAISQDPNSRPADRQWRYFVPDTDQYGMGEIQMWSGSLSNGDMSVLMLNAGNKPREMNASLVDIFWSGGPGGTAGQVKQTWDIYDLWANRMDDGTAAKLIAAANGTSGEDPTTIGTQYRYNATAVGGYASGLTQGLPVLLGKKIGTVQPYGTFNASVARHGVRFFRLRQSTTAGAAARREEL